MINTQKIYPPETTHIVDDLFIIILSTGIPSWPRYWKWDGSRWLNWQDGNGWRRNIDDIFPVKLLDKFLVKI